MQLDDEFIQTLCGTIKIPKASEVAKEAFTLLNWAVRERLEGRVILSADPDGQKVVRLVMPSLEAVVRPK